jgi:hypothetical protein
MSIHPNNHGECRNCKWSPSSREPFILKFLKLYFKFSKKKSGKIVEVVNNIPHSVENLSVAYSRVHQKIKSVDLSIVNSAHFKTIKYVRF